MSDEVANLTRFLDEHREIFRRKAGGLDPDQLGADAAAVRPDPRRHGQAPGVRRGLVVRRGTSMDVQAEPWASVDWEADDDWDWHTAADDTPEELWALWEDAVARSRRGGRDQRPDRRRAATRPRPPASRSALRWILAHMVEEYARHNGHADLIRQSIDGQVGDR